MLMLEDSDMIQLNNAAQHSVWKGQLYIHEQLVCDIALQASNACSIPAQLPQKLDLKEVIQVGELRKKLPEDIFQKTDLTGQEVYCGNIYYTLYPVITSNIVGSELDKLLKCLKDQDLALIKVLNDQGFLVLVNSAVLQSNTGICDGNSTQLYALFLFPHQKCLDKREREDWEGKDLPLTISNLLPGLHYAIIESSKLQKDKALYPGPLVEQYFRKFAVLQSKKSNSSERKPEQSEPLPLFNSHGDDVPKKCSQVAFSCLQLYVSSPVHFCVPLIRMSNILAENASLSSNSDQCGKTGENLIKQDSPSSASKLSLMSESKAGNVRMQRKHAVPEDKEQQSKRSPRRKSAKRRDKKSKKKAVHRAALTTAETGENQTSNKRRRLLSEGKQQIGSSSEATVKLASAPYPQRRKRGAEVLTAAVIQDDKVQTTDKKDSGKTNEENTNLTQKSKAINRKSRRILATEDHFLVPDRPPKRKAFDQGNKNMSVGVINKSESLKRTNERSSGTTGRAVKRSLEKMKNITVEQINTYSNSSENLRDAKKPPLSAQISEDSMMEKRIGMYESHALNLLADLALNAFDSTNNPYIKSGNVASANESLVEEAQSTSDTGSTVEQPPKDCCPPAQSTTAFKEADRILESESDKPKNGLNVSPRNIASQKRIENGEKQMSQKAHIAAAKAKARCNATSKICLEHSYSQLPIEDIPGKSAKEANEQPVQGVPDSTTPADIAPEPSTNGLSVDSVVLTSENVCPAMDKKHRAVSKCQDNNFVITFHREPKYDFDLDSKFTSDPLEKTINRALHGPWNPHLKEKVEDVKIILHMWLALFYSRSNKQITCSSRKVVEHSNPAKYVSINTVLDPFEFYEIMESDDAPTAENTNVILPMGKKSEALCQVNPIESVLSYKSGKSGSKSLQDLTVPSSISTKDYNIKLASEIFQVCQNSESALYSDSLQTSMMCQMAPTSRGAQTPANVMNTVSDTNVPTVCYIGDTNLFNTELTDKSESCMNIGGFSSEKAKSNEMEHKYSRDFSRINDAQKSAGSPTDCKVVSTNVDEKEENVCESVSSPGRTSQTHSDILNLHEVTMPPTTGDSHKTSSQLQFADMKGEYSCAESKTIHSPEIPSADDLNKDITHENPASVERSSENDENVEDLGKQDKLSVQSMSLLDASMPADVDNPESQDLLQASTLPSQELNDDFTIAEKPGITPDVALDNSADNDDQMTITNICSATGTDSPSYHYDVHTEFCMDKSSNMVDPSMNGEGLQCDKDSSGINHVGAEDLPAAKSLDTNIHCKSVQSEDFRQVGGLADSTASDLGPKGLAFCNSPDRLKTTGANINVDYNSNCTKEGKTDAAWDSVGFEDRQEKATENIPDEVGNLAEPKNTHRLDENVLNEITAADTMVRLELSNSSDEASDVECTDHINLGESSENTEGKEHSIGEHEVNTLVEDFMPVFCRGNSVPEEDDNVLETDVHQPGHISEASMVDEAAKEMPEEPFLTQNIAQPCLNDGDADLLNEAATDDGTRESKPSNPEVNLNSNSVEGSLLEASIKEVPSPQEKPATDHAEKSPDGACLLDEPSQAGADSCEWDGGASTSVLGDLDIEGSSETCTLEVSVQCQKQELHVHKENLTESQNQPAPFEGEKIENNTCSLETVNEEDDRSGSTGKEMQIDALSTNVETAVNLGLSKDILEGKSDVSDYNEKTLQPNITSSFSDQLLNKCHETDSVEKQQLDITEDVICLSPTVTPTKTRAKDSMHSSRNTSNSKKEILTKLKRICLGSITGQQISSTPNKNSISDSFTKEKDEVIDVEKSALPQDEDDSTLEYCEVVAEECAIDHSSPEESAITSNNSVEPETLEGVMPPQENCLISPSLEGVSDSMEQDPSPKLPDICFIVNTGSISKEQYDRWSETSDDDIEYIRSYQEPVSHQEPSQKEIHKSPNLFLDKVKCFQEQTTTDRTKRCFSRQPDSNSGLCEAEQDHEYNSITNRGNVIVTRNIKDPGRAVRTVANESSSRSDLDHLFSNRRMLSDDLTQNTLDMENVRFTCKLKEVLRKSSTYKHVHGAPFQTMFESRRIPSCSRSTTKCRSPLLITMHCPYRRTDFRRHDGRYPSTYNSSPYYEDDLWDRPGTYSRTIRKVRPPRYSPFHFSRLRYENTLDKSNTDISLILNECVQSNHLKLSSIGLGSTAVDRSSASQLAEDGGWQTRRMSVPVSSKLQTVKNIISDLCTSLHSRLQKVARVSEQKISFYIYETGDGDFISSAKSLLVKDGHVPTDPQDFLNSEHCESHQLLVIIKNEDVFSCINKIPYLMQLKLLPNVTFAGVDTPEDMMESTYEELFQAGGFVASEKSLLEHITVEKLKEVLTVLEKMNRTSPWKWLIHYRENRKLKEDKRAEALSRTKMSLLKSYQHSNVIEILPYHQCDSRSKEPSDDLSCLLNRQYQHIHSRLAVYLTGTTSTVTEEYEQNGILVYDVDTFLRKIQKVDSQFQASYWS